MRDSDIEIEEEAEDLVRLFETRAEAAPPRPRHPPRASTPPCPRTCGASSCDELDASAGRRLRASTGCIGLADTEAADRRTSGPISCSSPSTPRFPERIRDHRRRLLRRDPAEGHLVHHPYESFDVVVQFLRQAARDPDVVAIKQTLYRTSETARSSRR